jgi:hypothetical protein
MMKAFRHWTAVSPVLLILAMSCASAWGEDFRIESKTFSGKEKMPASETVTLFRAGVVYDYLTDPPGVAVFDKAHGRFILLNPTRKVKTEIKTDDVLTFAQSIKGAAGQSQNKFLKFSANPEFHSQFDEEREELNLTSPYMSYQVLTVKAKNLAAAQQYREFLDWYARLNAITNPSSLPPFPRLVPNEHLANRELIATQVQLTIPSQGPLGGKSQELRSEHKVTWRLLPRDLDKIAETANQLTAFKPVSFNDYRTTAGNRSASLTKR